MPDAEGRPTSPEDAAEMLREGWQRMYEERRKASEESQRQSNAMLRSEGIAGVVRVSGPTGREALIASGPDITGVVTLFLMNDGTVRWRRA